MKSYLKTKDFALTGEEFELLLNKEQDMLTTLPRPNDLAKYYDSEDYISHTDADKTLIDKMYRMVKRYSIAQKVKLAHQYCGASKSMLDFGAGTGDFLVAAKRNGWIVNGVEPNSLARTRAKEKGILLWQTLEESERQYSCITLWHVLEHLPDLEGTIAQLVGKLNPQGTLILAVPNYRSFDAIHYGAFWAAYDVPRHLWHFSSQSIKRLFASFDMEVVQIKPMPFDAFYVSLLSEKYKNGQNNYLRSFLVGLRSNISAWRTKEYSSLTYILQKRQK